jgi:hypothetical protein
MAGRGEETRWGGGVIDPWKGGENLWEGEGGGWIRRGQAWHAGVRLVCWVRVE